MDRGSEGKKMETQASGNKRNGEFQQRLKTCDRLTCVLQWRNQTVTQMTKEQTLLNLCTGFLCSSLETRKIDLLSQPLASKSGRINSSEARDCI